MKRNKHDPQENMFPCEINEMAKGSTLRTVELIEAMLSDSKVFRVDFLSADPPRVFGATSILLKKDMKPFEFTDALRSMADMIDEFLHRMK